MSVVARTYPRRPYAAFSKTGESLDLGGVLEGIRQDAELVARYALREMTEQNLALVTYFEGVKPAEAGRCMGLRLPSEVKGQFRSGASRLEMLFRERVVSTLRSWVARSGSLTKPIVATSLLGGGGPSRTLNQKTCNLGFLFLQQTTSTERSMSRKTRLS